MKKKFLVLIPIIGLIAFRIAASPESVQLQIKPEHKMLVESQELFISPTPKVIGLHQQAGVAASPHQPVHWIETQDEPQKKKAALTISSSYSSESIHTAVKHSPSAELSSWREPEEYSELHSGGAPLSHFWKHELGEDLVSSVAVIGPNGLVRPVIKKLSEEVSESTDTVIESNGGPSPEPTESKTPQVSDSPSPVTDDGEFDPKGFAFDGACDPDPIPSSTPTSTPSPLSSDPKIIMTPVLHPRLTPAPDLIPKIAGYFLKVWSEDHRLMSLSFLPLKKMPSGETCDRKATPLEYKIYFKAIVPPEEGHHLDGWVEVYQQDTQRQNSESVWLMIGKPKVRTF